VVINREVAEARANPLYLYGKERAESSAWTASPTAREIASTRTEGLALYPRADDMRSRSVGISVPSWRPSVPRGSRWVGRAGRRLSI